MGKRTQEQHRYIQARLREALFSASDLMDLDRKIPLSDQLMGKALEDINLSFNQDLTQLVKGLCELLYFPH